MGLPHVSKAPISDSENEPVTLGAPSGEVEPPTGVPACEVTCFWSRPSRFLMRASSSLWTVWSVGEVCSVDRRG